MAAAAPQRPTAAILAVSSTNQPHRTARSPCPAASGLRDSTGSLAPADLHGRPRYKSPINQSRRRRRFGLPGWMRLGAVDTEPALRGWHSYRLAEHRLVSVQPIEKIGHSHVGLSLYYYFHDFLSLSFLLRLCSSLLALEGF